jgi:hypothetical protein
MTDLRLCTLCDSLVDLEAEGVRELPRRGGNGRRITVIDAGGRLHVVTTKKLTEKRLAGARTPSPNMEEV